MSCRPNPFRRAAAALLPLALAACAGTGDSPTARAGSAGPGQCLFAGQISGFRAVDRDHVAFRVGVSEVWTAELFAPCQDLPFAEGVALRARTGAASAICSPVDAELIVPGPGGPQTCLLKSLTRLTPAEAAALPPDRRP